MNILLAVVLAASAWTSEILLEAEEATLIGVEVDDTREGFSGTGYVTGFDAPEDSLRFHVETGEGIYELHLSVALSRRAGSFSLWIDGVPYTGSLFVNPGAFIERSLGEYRLSEGSHTIVTAFGIWWSWFAVWSGDFIETLDADYLQHVFTSEHVLTRDELPAWRDYTTDTAPPLPVPSRSVALYPNPSAGPATLRMTLPTTADVRVAVFDVLGRQVRAYAFGVHPAGTFETIIEPGTAAGVYLVRVVAGSYVEHQSLIVTR